MLVYSVIKFGLDYKLYIAFAVYPSTRQARVTPTEVTLASKCRLNLLTLLKQVFYRGSYVFVPFVTIQLL